MGTALGAQEFSRGHVCAGTRVPGAASYTGSTNPTSVAPGLFLANSSGLKPRTPSYPPVIQVVLKHLSCGPGRPFHGLPIIFTRAKGNAEEVWGPAFPVTGLSFSFHICKMELKILRPALQALSFG